MQEGRQTRDVPLCLAYIPSSDGIPQLVDDERLHGRSLAYSYSSQLFQVRAPEGSIWVPFLLMEMPWTFPSLF
jgi:hypothetical protein